MHLSKPSHQPHQDPSSADRDLSNRQLPAGERYRRPRIRVRPMAALGWLFVTFILATGPLQLAVSDQSGRAYFSAAALGGLAIMGALLAAELRRAKAMTKVGIKVEAVEIGFLRGRVISVGEVATPRDLRRVTWAGLIGLAGSAAALAIAGGLLTFGSSPGVSLLAAAAWMSAIGIGALMFFDLLPAPGTPGSQLVFARSWRRSGRRESGAAATARAGVFSGWFLVVAGFAVVIFVSLAGLWLILVGALIIGGSRLMLMGARTSERLAGLRVSDVMSPAPPEVSSFATAEVAFTDIALPSRASVLIVREPDGSFGGIVPVTALAAVPGDDRVEMRVRPLAIPPSALATVTASEPIEHALQQMASHPAAGLAIVFDEPSGDTDNPHLIVVGTITGADLARTVDLLNAAGSKGRQSFAGRRANPFR